MDSFLYVFTYLVLWMKESCNYGVFIVNNTGLELNDKMKVYRYEGVVKRSISNASALKTVVGELVYSQCVDGYHEVYLCYVE